VLDEAGVRGFVWRSYSSPRTWRTLERADRAAEHPEGLGLAECRVREPPNCAIIPSSSASRRKDCSRQVALEAKEVDALLTKSDRRGHRQDDRRAAPPAVEGKGAGLLDSRLICTSAGVPGRGDPGHQPTIRRAARLGLKIRTAEGHFVPGPSASAENSAEQGAGEFHVGDEDALLAIDMSEY